MARQSVGFIDQHIEKVVLGLCGAVLVAAVVYSFFGFRYVVEGLSPGQLSTEVAEKATRLTEAVKNAQLRKEKKSGEKSEMGGEAELVKKWFDPAQGGLIPALGGDPLLPRSQRFPPSNAAGQKSSGERHNLVKIVSPGKPIVTAGQATFVLPSKIPLEEMVRSEPSRVGQESKRYWVAVAAQVNLQAQDENFLAEKYPNGSYLSVVKVHLQRKDESLPGADWENVDSYLPFLPIKRPSVTDSLEDFRRLLDRSYRYVFLGDLPERRGSGRIDLPSVPYLDELPKSNPDESSSERSRRMATLAKKWLDLAKKALEGKGAGKVQDDDAALMLARAAKAADAGSELTAKADELIDEIAKKMPKGKKGSASSDELTPPDRLMPIIAYDLDAEPGKAYVYRLRLEALNRYAGIPGDLNDPTDAERLTVFSDWSAPSRPVKLESETYFLLTKADAKTREAIVTVFRKRAAKWVSKDFKVTIGEEIGRLDKLVKKEDFSTGAVCVDIDFDRVVNGKKDVALVYLDTHTNLLRERLLSEDKNNELRKETTK